MGFLSNLTTYGAKWNVVDTTKLSELDEDGFNEIKRAEVVESEQEWGTSVSICLIMSDGRKYIPLSSESDLEVGDKVDPESIEIITLERDGDDAIYRADGEVLEEEEKPKSKRRSK